MNLEALRKTLEQLDGKGYKAYKALQGKVVDFPQFQLSIDYVQGDPFASPSRIRVLLTRSHTRLIKEAFDETHEAQTITVEDFLARSVSEAIRKGTAIAGGSGKSGQIQIDSPGQEILQRTAVKWGDKYVEIRLTVGLPAAGRKILGKQAIRQLCDQLPIIIQTGIYKLNHRDLSKHIQLTDQQLAIREFLNEHDLVAFIANGAILPRKSGVNNEPLEGKQVIPFQSPKSMEVSINLPHRTDELKGMGIKKGVSLIVGGGYHGKSTLLKAMERGVYNHIAGDGREYVITEASAVKIRAEDGRSVEKVNISPFISNLPFGKTTDPFSTEDASGSTSQAANIMEALEIGAKTLLVDEDTSATNFMIRDARMQELVAKGKEPITPFVDKVQQLFREKGVSTILVIGGSGDYFEEADAVIQMDEYNVHDATKVAKSIAQSIGSNRLKEGGDKFGKVTSRSIDKSSLDASKGKREKVDSKGIHSILYGDTFIDLSYVEQLVDSSQTRAIALMLKFLSKADKSPAGESTTKGVQTTLKEDIEELYLLLKQHGLEHISAFRNQHPGDYALPRPAELAAAINRFRKLRVK